MPGAGATFEEKKKFIAQISKELEQMVGSMSEQLQKMILKEFVDNLETEGGNIKNSRKNLELIAAIDKIYQDLMNKSGSKLAETIIKNVNEVSKFNFDYYSSLAINQAAYPATAKQIKQTIFDRLGVGDKTRLKPGGFMDSMLKDNRIRNELKKLSLQEVIKGSGFKNFKDQLQNYIVGNEENAGGFRQYFRQYAYDIYVVADRTEQALFATELDLKYFTYEGTIIETSREFCIKRAGKVFTIDEAKDWVNDPWIKKNFEKGYIASYDPINDMGLFGCRHLPRFISKQVAEALRPDLKGKADPVREKPPVKETPAKKPQKAPAVEKPKFEPAGKPIRKQFTDIQPKVAQNVNEALDAIDQVHGDGDLKDIPFELRQSKKYYGAFYHNRNGEPVSIALSPSGNTKFAQVGSGGAFTVVHEMGHYLDLYATGKRGSFSSLQSDSDIYKIVDKLKKTNAFATIEKAYKEKKLVSVKDEKVITVPPSYRKHLSYLMKREELWARAYAQYIAKKTGRIPLLISLAPDPLGTYAKYGIKTQWDDDDFKEIEKAIDEMMVNNKWVNQL